jgi:hypothetical protein
MQGQYFKSIYHPPCTEEKHGRPLKVEKEHWTQIDDQYLSRQFLDAVKRSNAYPNYIGRQIPSFHEVRALSIFMHKKAGKSAQQLAGHTTARMTEVYASGHEITWNDVDIGIFTICRCDISCTCKTII